MTGAGLSGGDGGAGGCRGAPQPRRSRAGRPTLVNLGEEAGAGRPGYAAMKDRHEFNAAIARAWREIDRDFTDDEPAWLRFVNRSEIAMQEARGRLFLGDPVGAVALHRRSMEASLSARNNANYRAHLTVALAASGDVNGAMMEGVAVLAALDAGRIMLPWTLITLEHVRQAATRHHSSDDFCAHYDNSTGRLSSV